MTAIVCMVGKNDVRLLTDGLTRNFYEGADAPPMTKVEHFGNFPGALTLRGARSILDYFADKLAPASTFDAAVALLEQSIAERAKEGRTSSYQLVFVGWSEAAATPKAYFVTGVPVVFKEPLKVYPIDRIMAIPSMQRSELLEFAASIDAERNFPTLMDKIFEKDRSGTIGAFCELTVVSEHGATSDIVKWYGEPWPFNRRHLRGMEMDYTLPDVFRRALLLGKQPERRPVHDMTNFVPAGLF